MIPYNSTEDIYEQVLQSIKENLTKCRTTGTNLTQNLRLKLKKFNEECGRESVEYYECYDKYGNPILKRRTDYKEDEVTLFSEEEREKLKEENITELHDIHNHPTNNFVDPLPTCLSESDINHLLMRNNEGDFIFRSIGVVSANGSGMRIIRDNSAGYVSSYDRMYSLKNIINHYRGYRNYYERRYIANSENYLKNNYSDLSEDMMEELISTPSFRKAVHNMTVNEIGDLNQYFGEMGVFVECERCGWKLDMNPAKDSMVNWDAVENIPKRRRGVFGGGRW